MTKPPSWNHVRARSSKFAARWVGEKNENVGVQSFRTESLRHPVHAERAV
jgi:hypothetical protein